jgi:hypothetical protein
VKVHRRVSLYFSNARDDRFLRCGMRAEDFASEKNVREQRNSSLDRKEPTTPHIGRKAPTYNQHSLLIDFSNSGFQCKNGFHFYDGEARDNVLGIRL